MDQSFTNDLLPPLTGREHCIVRHLLGVSRRMLANRAGVSHPTIAAWERSPAALPPEARAKLAAGFRTIALARIRQMGRAGLTYSDLAAVLARYETAIDVIDWATGLPK